MNLKIRYMEKISFLLLLALLAGQMQAIKPKTKARKLARYDAGTNVASVRNFTQHFLQSNPHHFNATAWRVNDTKASYWKKAPHFYNGTHFWNGTDTIYCAPIGNGTNGTNCTEIYGDDYFKNYFDEDVPNCQVPLMQSYGFSGRNVSNETEVPMCKNIKHSCCNYEDQLWMHRNWNDDGVEDNLNERMEYFNNTYKEFVEALGAASSTAAGVSTKLHTTNNCKVLANTIAQFDTLDVFYNLGQLSKNVFEYHSDNFESFYCTLCDAENHQFFDLTHQRVIYNYQHCKDIAEHTLPFLLYFHVHLVKIVNLLVDFVASCDSEGNYHKVEIDESLFKLQVDRTLRRKLLRCRRERNRKGWFGACLPICSEYSMTKLSKFFLPNFRKMSPIASFIKGNIQIIKNHALHLLDDHGAHGAKGHHIRMLEDREKMARSRTEKPKRNLQQKSQPLSYGTKILRTLRNDHLERLMIPGAIGQSVDVDRLKPTYKSDGINAQVVHKGVRFEDHEYEVTFDEYIEEEHPLGTHEVTEELMDAQRSGNKSYVSPANKFAVHAGGMSGALGSSTRLHVLAFIAAWFLGAFITI